MEIELANLCEECPICLRTIKNKYTTSCNHTFCKHCIWYLYRRGEEKCPLCRCYFSNEDSDKLLNLKMYNVCNCFFPLQYTTYNIICRYGKIKFELSFFAYKITISVKDLKSILFFDDNEIKKIFTILLFALYNFEPISTSGTKSKSFHIEYKPYLIYCNGDNEREIPYKYDEVVGYDTSINIDNVIYAHTVLQPNDIGYDEYDIISWY